MYCLAAVGMVVQAQINCKTILFGLFSFATAIQDVMPMQISSHFAEEAGEITGLERQARYILVGSQKREDGTTERPVSYTADFRYTDKEGKIVVEDVKSPRTRKNPEYIIKRKLMLERYGITIREVA